MEGSKIQQDTAAFLAVAVDKSKPASLLREEEEKTKMHHAYLPMIQLVSSWSLSFAFIYGAMAAHMIYGDITCDQSSYWTSCYILTGSAGDEATKLVTAMLWTSVAQAAVSVLALLMLGCCCCRRALVAAVSLVALGLAMANHCMMARTQYIFLTAYPGDALLIFTIVLTSLLVLTGLLLGFLTLVILVLSGDDQEY